MHCFLTRVREHCTHDVAPSRRRMKNTPERLRSPPSPEGLALPIFGSRTDSTVADTKLNYLASEYQQRLFGMLVPQGEEMDDEGWFFARCPTREAHFPKGKALDAQINWLHGSIRCLHDEPCGGTKRGVRTLTKLLEGAWIVWLSERGYE